MPDQSDRGLTSDAPGDDVPSWVTAYVGQRITALRVAEGLTQRELARKLRIQQGTLANWELGKHEMDLIRLVAVARALSVPLVALLPLTPQDVEWVRRQGGEG